MVARYIDYSAEAYGLFLALNTDSNIPVDFIDEDAMEEPETLAQFKLIFIAQPDIPTRGMKGLLRWAARGGTLVSVSNAGGGDEYNTPSSLLSDATGVSETARKRMIFASDDTLPVAAHGTVAQSLPFTAFGVAASLNVSQAARVQTLARYADGRTAATRSSVGSSGGAIIRFGWLPGVSYWFSHPPKTVGNRPRNGSGPPGAVKRP
jgi:hypothetical protein